VKRQILPPTLFAHWQFWSARVGVTACPEVLREVPHDGHTFLLTSARLLAGRAATLVRVLGIANLNDHKLWRALTRHPESDSDLTVACRPGNLHRWCCLVSPLGSSGHCSSIDTVGVVPPRRSRFRNCPSRSASHAGWRANLVLRSEPARAANGAAPQRSCSPQAYYAVS